MAFEFAEATQDTNALNVFFSTLKLKDWASGTFLTIAPQGDDFSLEQGGGGLAVWVNKPNRVWDIEFVLMAASLQNEVLWGIYELDRQTPGGVMHPFTFNEMNGTTKLAIPRARIVRAPTILRGTTPTNMSWKLQGVGGGIGIVGGLNQTPVAP